MNQRVKAGVMLALPALAVLTATACGGPATTTSVQYQSASTQPAASPSAAAQASSAPSTGGSTALGGSLSCDAVVDPDPSTDGLKGSDLTAEQVIADLGAMLLVDGTANITAGTPSDQDTTILTAAALDLENYSGTKLAGDAATFASDEKSYAPDGSVDTSYASAVQSDIRTLMTDCPASAKDAVRLAG